MTPRGILIDCGGTLLEEAAHDIAAGDQWLLDIAVRNPSNASLNQVTERRARIEKEVVVRRDQCHLETPWPVITKLIYDYFSIQFGIGWESLELEFWKRAMKTHPMPGAAEALSKLLQEDIPVGVLSNSIYRPCVLLHELEKYGLAESVRFVMTSAEHGVRKPDPLLFEIASAKLGRLSADIWFVGDKLEIDVKGAMAAGMTPVWFQPPASAPSPCQSVSSWYEFLRLCEEA